MSYPDRKQVRHCLHKLGYGDIPDDQFELFIRGIWVNTIMFILLYIKAYLFIRFENTNSIWTV